MTEWVGPSGDQTYKMMWMSPFTQIIVLKPMVLGIVLGDAIWFVQYPKHCEWDIFQISLLSIVSRVGPRSDGFLGKTFIERPLTG